MHGSRIPGQGPGNEGGGEKVDCIDPGSCAGSDDEGGAGGGDTTSCGAETFPIAGTRVAPNVFLIVDASGSMATGLGGGFDPSKWNGLQAALGNVLTVHAGAAQFGLSLYPAGSASNSCQAGQVDVPIGTGTESAIRARVDGVSAQQVKAREGFTPTAATLEAAMNVGGLQDPTRPNYVVLMTDGLPNCQPEPGPARTVAALTALRMASQPVRTFVVGFGQVSTSSPDILDAFAEAGGTARTGAATKFYPAADAADLEDAFDQIVSGLTSCEFKLDAPPADASLVSPTFDGVAVIADATNGFSYDAATQLVSFHGLACDKLRSGAVTQVEFIYGCEAPDVL